MALTSYTPTRGYATFESQVYPKITVTTLSTAAALTYTAAQLLGGMILRNPNGAARSDVFPTAASIVAAIMGCDVASAFEFDLRNTAAAAETITMTAGTGITISGTATVAQLNTKRFRAVVTNRTAGSEAVTIYSLGTVVF